MTSITWTQRGRSNRDTRREEPKMTTHSESWEAKRIDWRKQVPMANTSTGARWLTAASVVPAASVTAAVAQTKQPSSTIQRNPIWNRWHRWWWYQRCSSYTTLRGWVRRKFRRWKKEVGNWTCEMHANSNRIFEGRISGSRRKNWNPTWLMTQHYTWNELLSHGVATCAGSSTLKLRIVVWRTSVAGFGSLQNMELSCRARLGETEWIML